MERLKNKVVIITGGALGIGRATAIVLAGEGAKVAVTDILINEGNSTVKQIRDAAGEADFWHLDVSDENEVRRVFYEIAEKFGSINVLVNNAGIAGANKPVDELTSEEWDRVMNVNVKGVFYCTKYAIPYMRRSGGGSIINLSSIYGIISNNDVPPYHASKGAVRLMTKTDALYYARDKIRVNSVHPGFIWTPMVENYARSQGDPETVKNAIAQLHPLGVIGDPEDVAYGILYLASDESRFVTGSELVIDGGYTAR